MRILRPLGRQDMLALAIREADLWLLGEEVIVLGLHRFLDAVDSVLGEEGAPGVAAGVLLAAFGDEEEGVEAGEELLLRAAEVLLRLAFGGFGEAVGHLVVVGLE